MSKKLIDNINEDSKYIETVFNQVVDRDNREIIINTSIDIIDKLKIQEYQEQILYEMFQYTDVHEHNRAYFNDLADECERFFLNLLKDIDKYYSQT